MNEYQIAQEIRRILAEDKNNMPEVPTYNFMKIWFHRKPYTNVEFADKLRKFADRYNFGYITVLDHRKAGVAVRFWEKEQSKLLEEKNGSRSSGRRNKSHEGNESKTKGNGGTEFQKN